MKVTTLVLNAEGDPHFEAEDHIDLVNLFEIAEIKKQNIHDKGEEFVRGAVSHYGSEVVSAVNTGEYEDVTKAIIQLVLVTWIYEELYLGSTRASFQDKDLKYTITQDGIVMHTKVSKVNH